MKVVALGLTTAVTHHATDTYTHSQNTHLSPTTAASVFPPLRAKRSGKHWQRYNNHPPPPHPPISPCSSAGRTFTINRKHLSRQRKCYSLIGLMWFNDHTALSQWEGAYFKRRYKREQKLYQKAQTAPSSHTDYMVCSRLNFCKLVKTLHRHITKHIWFHCCFMDPITHHETTV